MVCEVRQMKMIVVKMHSDQIYKLKIEEQVFHIFHYQNFIIFASEHIFMTPNQSGRFSFQHITYIECNIHSDVLKSTWKRIKLTLCFLYTLLVLLCTIHWCTLIQRKKWSSYWNILLEIITPSYFSTRLLQSRHFFTIWSIPGG